MGERITLVIRRKGGTVTQTLNGKHSVLFTGGEVMAACVEKWAIVTSLSYIEQTKARLAETLANHRTALLERPTDG